MRFCNDGEQEWWTKSLLLSTVPNKQEQICLYLANKSDTDITISIDFVDGTRTAWDDRKACKPAGEEKNFWQFVSTSAKEFTIPAQDVLKHIAFVEYPTDYAGMSYGCVTAQIAHQEKDTSMVSIVQRRANFVDVFVQWDIQVWLTTIKTKKNNQDSQWVIFLDTIPWTQFHASAWVSDSHITLEGKNWSNERQSSLSIYNPGTIRQDIALTTTYTPLFGTSTVITEKQSLLPWDTRIFSNTLDIPWYQTFWTITAEIEHEAIFDFESDMISDDMRKQHNISLERKAIILPYKILLWLASLLLLWIIYLARKKFSMMIHHQDNNKTNKTDKKQKKTKTKITKTWVTSKAIKKTTKKKETKWTTKRKTQETSTKKITK